MKYACALCCLAALFLPDSIKCKTNTEFVPAIKADSPRSASNLEQGRKIYTVEDDPRLEILSTFSKPNKKQKLFDTYNKKWKTQESDIERKYYYQTDVDKTEGIRYSKKIKRQLSDEAKGGTSDVATEDPTTPGHAEQIDSSTDNSTAGNEDSTVPPYDIRLESERFWKFLRSPKKALNESIDDLPPPLVNTTEGVVRGKGNRKYGISYMSFEGIPYASLPERFQAPNPPKPWDGIKNATEETQACAQQSIITGSFFGIEDCLTLNIYTPSVDDKGRPVIVIIHGGGFNLLMGNRLSFGPENLMNEDSIVVLFNYRLGALGFLATLTPEAPGNAGMKDMVAALTWIQRNIKNFGGDPDKVTLYGSSSGSAAVEYLTITKMAKGLFSKIIMQSGSVLNYMFYDNDPIKYALRLGNYMGFHTADVRKLVEHLKTEKIEKIVESAQKMGEDILPIGVIRPFTPCVETPLPGVEMFLHDYPENILRGGDFIQVPSMIGFNSLEGSEFIKGILFDPEYLNSVDNTFEYLIPPDLTDAMDRPQKRKTLVEKVREFYFKGEKISNATAKNYLELMGDQIILYGLFESVNIRSKKSEQPIYFWEMTYDGELGMLRKYLRIGVEGAGHADELGYLFNIPFFDGYPVSNQTREVSQRLIKFVGNFMKYGNPTPETTELLPVIWEPLDGNNPLKYLRMSEKVEMMKDPQPYNERVAFWRDLYAHKNELV